MTAAFVETIPIALDDNLSVALSAGGVLWLVAIVVARRVDYRGDGFVGDEYLAIAPPTIGLFVALAANAIVAVAGYLARTVSIAGAVTGAVIGTAIFASLGWQGWTLLAHHLRHRGDRVAPRAGAQAASRYRRVARRTPRSRERDCQYRRRGDCGGARLRPDVRGIRRRVSRAPAALATAGSDTLASEIGKAYGRTTLSITSLSRVPPGTSGAMSLDGTAAGVSGALGLGATAAARGLVPYAALPAIVAGATVGALVESWLGATLEGPGILNNDVLNFINSVSGLAATLALWRWLH